MKRDDKMSCMSMVVGENIRKIRKAKNITLVNMAQAINKGKSTVSKYETGEISIDVDTLWEISKFLSVPTSSLLAAEHTNEPNAPLSNSFSKKFFYFFDGRVKKIICAVMEEYSSLDEADDCVLMYFDVKDESNYKSCSSFYKGSVARCEFVDNYSMLNQNNSAERVWVCCLKNLRNADVRLGVLSGLSYKTMLPVSIKALISNHPLAKDKALEEMLFLSKEDIKLIKKNNMFTLCEREQSIL